jgi:hypothetical protein
VLKARVHWFRLLISIPVLTVQVHLFSQTTLIAATKNSLMQNRPNPFGETTTIECNVSEIKSAAFIIIYDLSGKELMKFKVNGTGNNKVNVSGRQLAQGMYLYSLVVDGEEIDTKKNGDHQELINFLK